ncbi:MAG: CotH kinase family protein [Ruminococcus sp.]|nr:CotH kinase family protein [Ruminococcus sp.]
MKKAVSVLLCAVMLLSFGSVLTVGAQETTDKNTVPKVMITTEGGNGNELEKADGYVPASVRVEDTDGSVLEEAGKVKVRGNSTAMAPKKPFTFKFDKKQDVLGMGKAKKWALLANCFDPTMMRNYIAFDAAHELGMAYTSEQQYVEVWMDGVYKGCYTLTEPVEVGKTRVDIDVESNDGLNDFMVEYEASRKEDDVTYFLSNGYRFAASEPEEPTDEQKAYMQAALDRLTDAFVSKDFDRMAEVVDMDSFAKFYLLNEFVKNVDANFSSVYYYYHDGKFYAGPAWDYDLTQGNPDPTLSNVYRTASEPQGLFVANCNLFHYLMISNRFRALLRPIYTEHYAYFQHIYTEGGLIDRLLDQYGAVFARNFDEGGWDVGEKFTVQQRQPLPTFAENVAFLRDWLHQHNAFLGNDLYAYDMSVAKVVQTNNNPRTLEVVAEWMKGGEEHDFYVEVEATQPLYCKRVISKKEAVKTYSFTSKKQIYLHCDLPVWASPESVSVRIVIPDVTENLEAVTAAVNLPEPQDGETYVMGDVNRDGAVNIDDATEIQKIVASVTDADAVQAILGDINADGVVDITEATRIQRSLAEQPADKYTENIGKTFVM